ncbi:hypothetical protein ES332_D06G035200v1 [Gossypium tomentosum]|uniref:Uncharacterized protein n=1 Tax=Gossypium tomentosum TaxID=34277 RepID=A0A5D2KET5_GOSTO|nr:hypothetical protein ES332_D06G035200v1 [Gossypium tomentosum]
MNQKVTKPHVERFSTIGRFDLLSLPISNPTFSSTGFRDAIGTLRDKNEQKRTKLKHNK